MKKSLFSVLVMGLLAGVILLGLWAGCGEGKPPDRQLSPPLKQLSYQAKNEVFVSTAPQVRLADLFDLSVFASLKPGVNAQEARKSLGVPPKVYQEYQGRDTVYAFPRPSGVIEVVEQQVDSEGFEGIHWFLRWRPQDRRPEACLDRVLLQLLPGLPETVSLKVRSDDGAMAVEIQDGFVSAVQWLHQELEVRR